MTYFCRRQDDAASAGDVVRMMRAAYEANEPVILTPQRISLIIDLLNRTYGAELREFVRDRSK